MKPTRVGDIVRFAWAIQCEDGGILSAERGIVVGFEDDRRRVRLVWNDGTPGVYRARDLARESGTIGSAVAGTKVVILRDGRTVVRPDRGKPLKDRCRKPVSPSARPIINPLPHRETAWNAVELKRVEAIVSDKPYVDATGKRHEKSFMRFAIPIVTLRVQAAHWASQHAWTITRSRFGLKVIYGDGRMVDRIRPRDERDWLVGRFGAGFADKFLAMCRPTAG